MKPLKPKKCRQCKEPFTPRNSLQVVCSPLCAIAYEKDKATKKAARVAKSARKAHRADLNAFRDNDRALQLTKAQAAFNKFIRLRDKDLPCISCGKVGGRVDAGHYRTVGSTKGIALNGIPIRFHEDNCHAQCSMNCNKMRSGNVVELRIGLIKKIGAERVEAIENAHEQIKLSLDDIRAIRDKYKAKCKEVS